MKNFTIFQKYFIFYIVSAVTSVDFQQDREGILYVGTPVNLTCTVTVDVDMSVVDTNITVSFNFVNLPSDARRVSISSTPLNSSTFLGVVEFRHLLPSDRSVAFGCASTVQPVENGVPVVNPTVTHTMKIEGEHSITFAS